MDSENVQYMCPRPRAWRACVPCKARKTRCLPSSHSNHCQRCDRIGILCSYNDVPASRKNGRNSKSSSTAQVMDDNGSSLDSVFEQIQPCTLDVQYQDESDKLFQLHGNIFESNQRDELETSLSQPQHSDQKREYSAKRSRAGKPGVTTSKIYELIQTFHTQSICFPFVTIAKNETVETLRHKSPFLLLSILVVASAANPMLQMTLDEHLRKVLATRVVMQGEKSLDYLQGLLVYLAWHPVHLKPFNNQIWQYTQLANAMAADLNLESRIRWPLESGEDQRIARNTIIGCYFHSLSVSMGMKRPNTFTFSPSDELLHSMLRTSNDQNDDVIACTALLSKFTGKVYNCDPELEMTRLSNVTGCPLQNLTHGYQQELDQIESNFPAHVYTNIKIQLMQKFAKVTLYSLGLKQSKPPLRGNETSSAYVLHQINPASYLELFSTCLTEIKTLIDFFLDAPSADYRKYTFREWVILIQIIIMFPKLHNFSIIDTAIYATWQELIASERIGYIDQLERLYHRLKDVSATRHQTQSSENCSIPDSLYLLYSVMKLFKDNFVRESTVQLQTESQQHRFRTQCPVMSGEIRNTEYWDLLMQNNNTTDPMGSSFDMEILADFELNDPLYFDLDSWIEFSGESTDGS